MKQDKEGLFDGWQQFVIHVIDEYGQPVPDYVVDLYRTDPRSLDDQGLANAELKEFDLDVHAYAADQSFRCFHVRVPLNASTGASGELWMRLTASTGTELLAYQGYTADAVPTADRSVIVLNISHLMAGEDALFCPFTTTLVEIKLTREPLPLQGQTRLMGITPYTPPLAG